MKSLICAIASTINALVAIHIGLLAFGFDLLSKFRADAMLMSPMVVEGPWKYVMILIGISGVVALVGHIRCWRGCPAGGHCCK